MKTLRRLWKVVRRRCFCPFGFHRFDPCWMCDRMGRSPCHWTCRDCGVMSWPGGGAWPKDEAFSRIAKCWEGV